MRLLSKKQQSDKPPRRDNSVGPAKVRATPEDLDNRYNFRRNRTLTGSLSSRVSSANEFNSELKSTRIQHHDLRHHRRRLSLVLLVSLATVGVLVFVLFQMTVFTNISTLGNLTVDTDRYNKVIHDYLNRRPLQRFRLALNTEELAKYLQANGLPEVESVGQEVVNDGFVTSKLSLEFRRPAVVWRSGDKTMYVDSDGNAFTKNYFQEPTVEVVDQTGINTNGNQVLASNRFLGTIGQVVGQMKRNGHEVTKITLPANTTRQVDVNIQGTQYIIKFSVDRSAGEQSEDASRAIGYLASHQINPSYLDVRVSNRAYYK